MDHGGSGTGTAASTSSTELTPFVVALCDENFVLIDAVRRTRVRTSRKDCDTSTHGISPWFREKDDNHNGGGGNGDDEEEHDTLDNNAVVAYDLILNDIDLITASRNGMLRRYTLSFSSSHTNHHY